MLGRAKPEAVARTQWQQDRKTAPAASMAEGAHTSPAEPCPTLRSALRNGMGKMTALSPKTFVLLLILLTPFALGVDTVEVRGDLLIGRQA